MSLSREMIREVYSEHKTLSREEVRERAEMARELLLRKLHDEHYKQSEIRCITGLTSRTIEIWDKAVPNLPRLSTVEKMMKLSQPHLRHKVQRRWIKDREKIEWAHAIVRRAVDSGMRVMDIAPIMGMNQSALWYILNESKRNHVSLTFIEGAERLERHLDGETNRAKRRNRKIKDLINE